MIYENGILEIWERRPIGPRQGMQWMFIRVPLKNGLTIERVTRYSDGDVIIYSYENGYNPFLIKISGTAEHMQICVAKTRKQARINMQKLLDSEK